MPFSNSKVSNKSLSVFRLYKDKSADDNKERCRERGIPLPMLGLVLYDFQRVSVSVLLRSSRFLLCDSNRLRTTRVPSYKKTSF